MTTLFVHPRIYTLVDDRPISGAIVVRDGRIVAVAPLAEARELAGAGATEVTLPGEAVIPGLHDAHLHLAAMAAESLAPDLFGAADLAEVRRRLEIYRDTTPGDGWVSGGRYNANLWPVGEVPHRELLDDIFGDRPVALSTVDGHATWANSAALRLAGINEHTPDPDGGQIVRDASGVPTGLLLENAADPVGVLMPSVIAEQPAESVARVQQDMLSVGLTAATCFDGEHARRAFAAARDAGQLHVRIVKAVRAADLDLAIEEGRTTGDGDEWLRTGAVKFFSDGALGPHTAHLHEGYEDDPENHGIPVMGLATMVERFRKANEAGLAVATHAIGDKANTTVLDAYEQVADIAAKHGLRNSIEHAQHIKPADIERFARLGVIASLQPTHCTSDYPLSVRLLGQRDTLHYPWRSLLDAGAPVAFGSDAPVEPENPFLGIHAAVTRETREGDPAGGREPEQKVTVLEALRAFTYGAAYAAGWEADLGGLEPGKFADFIAIDTDPFSADPGQIPLTTVLTTVVGGEVRYEG